MTHEQDAWQPQKGDTCHLEVVAGVTSRELGSQLTQSQNSRGKMAGYELRAGYAAPGRGQGTDGNW